MSKKLYSTLCPTQANCGTCNYRSICEEGHDRHGTCHKWAGSECPTCENARCPYSEHTHKPISEVCHEG